VNPDPARFRQVRKALLAQGLLLIALGAWGVIAAVGYRGAAVTGAPVLVFRFTVVHALVLLGTGVLSAASAARRRWGLWFSIAQAVGYFLVFIISGGHHNSFSDPVDAALHGTLATLGLVLVMWTAARALDGSRWVHKPATDRDEPQQDPPA
jgi:hypothetical protein